MMDSSSLFTRRDLEKRSPNEVAAFPDDARQAEQLPPKRYGAIILVAHPDDVQLPDREKRFLVIRRSRNVIAPNALCFPGGGIEPGETPEEAARREFREEVGGELESIRQVWRNVTPWRVALTWFFARLCSPVESLRGNKREVANLYWLTLGELQESPDTLLSNLPFLDAVLEGRRHVDTE